MPTSVAHSSVRQLVAVLAVEPLPAGPRGELGVEDQAVEVEEEGADRAWRCRVRTWRSSASTSAARSPTPCSSRTGRSARPRCRPRRGRRSRCSRRPRGRRGRRASTRFAHGTTVATNALLERRGARTAYVGERRLRASAPPAAADARAPLPACAPSIPSRSCRSSAATACAGRLGPDGELEPLDLGSLPDVGDAEAVAVCLLFAFRDPRARAGRRGRAAARGIPASHVVASHEVAPEFREYERASTTAADAYLAPVAARYLRALAGAAAEARTAGAARDALVRRRAPVDEAAAHPATTARLRAGRRRRRRGARRAARGLRARDRVRHGRHVDRRLPAAGRPRRARAPSARSAACRSGCRPSTCTRSAPAAARSCGATPAAHAGRARVGGRDPGPRATAGRRPTVTDANLLLGGCRTSCRAGSSSTARGRGALAGIDPRRSSRSSTPRCCARCASSRSSGARPSRVRARRVRRRRAAPRVRARGGAGMGGARTGAASGVGWRGRAAGSGRKPQKKKKKKKKTTSRVVRGDAARARVVSVERGHDPRDFALVAFGGAGPLHACALAEELGIEAVLVPAAAGVLSALGLVASDERRDRVVSYVRPLADAGDLPPRARPTCATAGQSFELTVPLGGELAERFHRAHEERYGYADRGRARSSSSPSAPPRSCPARSSSCRAANRSTRRGPALRRAGRLDLLDSPRVGGG